MIKQVSKHLDYNISELNKKLNALTYRDFLIFRKKFCGMFIFRGKKNFAIKIFHYILLNLKKYRINPMKLFFFIIKRITPFLMLGQRKYRNNLIAIPSFIYGNKKNVILLNWVVRQCKNKSNIYGIKKQDVLKILIDILNLRGSVLKLKAQHNRKVLLTKINLKNEGIDFGDEKAVFKRLQKERALESKYTTWWNEIKKLNEDFDLDDDEIEDELQRWKYLDKKHKYKKIVKKSFSRFEKKKKDFLDDYKFKFVK